MKFGLSITLILVGGLTLQGCEGFFDGLNAIPKDTAPILGVDIPFLSTRDNAYYTKKYADKACRYANRSVTNRAEAKANADAAIKAANTATDYAVAAHKAAVRARKDDPEADEGSIAKAAANDAKKARKCANSIRGVVLNMKPDTVAAAAADTGISAQDLQGD